MKIESDDKTPRILREAVDWPPSVWVASFSGSDTVVPNLSTALIEKAVEGDDTVELSIVDGGLSFSSTFRVHDERVRSRVAAVLTRAKGMTVSETGEQRL